jgi:short-subunit dehydrogenase
MRALVTGASSGIGLALAGELAVRGFDLVIAARHDDLLDAADALRRPGIEVTPVRADLATAAGVDQIVAALAGRPLAVAALNAGTAAGGAFGTGTTLEDQLAVVDLNVRGTVQLAHHVTAAMVARGEGRILFTSSIAANMPGPFDAVYNASKSFVQSFALALRNELKDTGVTVTSLMPGPSDTALFEKAGMGDTRVGAGPKDDHAEVARMGVEALLAGKERATASSLRTQLEAVVSRLVPDAVKAELHRRMSEPGSAPR